MSAAYDAATKNLNVTASVGGSQCDSWPAIEIEVEGFNFGTTSGCPSLGGCTLTWNWGPPLTSCLAPGQHTVTANFYCNNYQNTPGGQCFRGTSTAGTSTFNVPSAIVSSSISIEQLTSTSIRVHMPYVLQGNGTAAVKLDHYLPTGAGDGIEYTDTAYGPSGEVTKDYNIACWLPGPHRFVSTISACNNDSRVTETSYQMPDETPTIAASVVVTGPNAIRVDMPFSFPPSVGGGYLELSHTKPDGSGDGVVWWGPGNQQSGSWSQSFDTTCWPSGTHTFTALARSCNRTSKTATATYEVVRKPHVDVSIQKTANTKTALVTYNFPDNEPNGRSVNVEFLPVFPGTGVTQLASLQPVPSSTGSLTVDISSFGTSGMLRARASNSCGETDVKDTFVDCDCHANEGPNTAPRPVRLWDGSMTYSERDPFPSEGGMLFTRNYDTNSPADGVFGMQWRSALDAGLSHFTDGPFDTVTIQMEGERKAAFIKSGGVWTQTWPAGISPAFLTQQSDGTWQYRDAGSFVVRLFRSDGHFAGFDDRASGTNVRIDYNASGQPQRVYSVDGAWSCTITMTGAHITSMAIDGRPDLVWQYSYSGSLLQSVTLSGSSSAWRTYEYTGGLLSAVRDAAGNLIESHTFDAYGRAIDSIGAGGPDITNIEYDLPGTLSDSTITRVTYATGEQTTFDERFIKGRQQTFAVNGGCGSCGSRNATYAVDEASGQVVRMQDARGYITSYTYDTTGRLIHEQRYDRPATCDPEQDPSHCRMTAAALLTAALQSTTASTHLDYAYGDSVWRDKPTLITMPSVLRPASARTDFMVYDATTGIPLVKTSSGWVDGTNSQDRRTTTTLYDGVIVAAFNPGRNFSSSWLTLPQPAGRKRTVVGPRTALDDITQFVYYPIDNSVPATCRGRLAAVKNAAGHITTFESYDVFGNPARVVDLNGVATESTYDGLGRVLTTTLKGVSGCDTAADPLCATDLTTSRTYSPATGPLASQMDALGNVTTYEYDARGRMTALSRGPSASSLKERMEYTYDAASGRKSLERYLAMNNGSWVEKRRESYSYDSLAQLTAQTHADNSSIAYSYDDAGSLASVRDENHSAANTHYSYDPARRLAAVQQTLGNGGIATTYTYDIAGNLASVTDPNGNLTSYGYDDFSEMISQTSPVTGTTSYSYGTAGELLSSTDANGVTTTRTYDALSRIRTTVSSRSGQSDETVNWSYEAGTFGLGRLTQMTDPSGATVYTYDRRGLLLSESRTSGSVLLATSFAYDANGNRTAITYPSGATATYAYDHAGRPTSLASSGVTYVSGATYLPFGPETSLTFANGTTQTRAYDTRYRIQRNTLTGPSGAIADYTYTEDPAGNIASIHDMLDPTYNRDFGYDDLNRLTTANTGLVVSSLWGTGSYRYDAMGNMLGRDLGAMVDNNDPLLRRGGTLTARPDSLPATSSIHETYAYFGTTAQLATVTRDGIDHPITYDNAGNELHYYDTRTYSLRNLMSSITEPGEDNRAHKINYGYDGRGVRVTRSEGMTNDATPFATRYYVYTPELQLLAVTADDNANVWAKRAITNLVPAMSHQIGWFNGRPVLDFVGTSTLLYNFDDHLGTPILQTSVTGAVVWRAEYEPYGDIWAMRQNSDGTVGRVDAQLLRFPGQEYAGKWEGMEERYNIFRWYRAGWGRYTQPDPVGLAPDVDLFRYVSSNPLKFVDPIGLFCTEDFVAHFFLGGGAPIHLENVGLLPEFVNSMEVQSTMAVSRHNVEIALGNLLKERCAGTECRYLAGVMDLGDNSWYVNVFLQDDTPCVGWPIGSSMLVANTKCRYSADCKARSFSYHCSSKWRLRDRFTNPLSQGKPGGNPGKYRDTAYWTSYFIFADWQDYLGGRGSW